MLRQILSVLCLLWIAGVTGSDAKNTCQDFIVTHDGKRHLGQVVYEGEQSLILRSKTRLRSFPKEKVKEVRAVLRELPKALAKLRLLAPTDIPGNLKLAREMLKANLPHEAKLLYWRVLTLDETNEVAHQALEHRQVKGAWKARAGSGWLSLPALWTYRSHWNDSWELETSHFLLRSNMPLGDALLAAFDLEYTYANFYKLFGKPLELHASRKKIGVWLHGDTKSYDDPHQGRGGFYQEKDLRFYVNGTLPGWRNTVIHEGVHGILDFVAAHTKTRSGHIPGWLHEGLALYMQPHKYDDSYTDEPRAIGSSGPIRWLIRLHAAEQDPYSLGDILNMAWEDFGLDLRRDLRYAQAYSLTYFCLNAGKGKHRLNFFKFVRGTLEGRSSAGDFRNALGLEESELETGWELFVRNF